MGITEWGNTKLGEYIGSAAIIVAIGLGASFFMKGCSDALYRLEEMDKLSAEITQIGKYPLQEAYLNDNDIPDKFYVIDGKIVPVEVDGKSTLEKALKE